MEDKLREAFDAIHAKEELKEKTRGFLARKANGYAARRTVRYVGLAAAALCLLCVLIGGGRFYFTPAVTVSVDINPSLELGVNGMGVVVSVEGRNDDGQELAQSLAIRFLPYEEAITRLVEDDRIAALLSEDELLTVTVIGGDEGQSRQILDQTRSCLADRENVYCCLAQPEEVQAAHETGLSYGKYRAFLELQALDPAVSPEEIQGMTMREIRDRIEALSESAGDLAAEETTGQHGYGWGQENGWGPNGGKRADPGD